MRAYGFILILLFITEITNGQVECNPDVDVTPAMQCADALNSANMGTGNGYVCDLDGYCSRMASGTWGNERFFCSNEGVLNNPNWFSFRANSQVIDIDVFISNCDTITIFDPLQGQVKITGIQWGLYDQCNNTNNAILCNALPGVSNESSFKIRYTNATVGKLYIVLLDGQRGSICDYKIRVNEGIGTTFVEKEANASIVGQANICIGSVQKFSVAGFKYATSYTWTLNDEQIESNGNQATLDLGKKPLAPGIYQLCAEGVNECDREGQRICLEVAVAEPLRKTLEASVCQGFRFEFKGREYEVGQYIIPVSAGSGCDTIYELNVKARAAIHNPDIQYVTKCAGDGPVMIHGQTCRGTEPCDIVFTAGNGCDSIVTYRLADIQAEGNAIATPSLLPCYGGKSELTVSGLEWSTDPAYYDISWFDEADQEVSPVVDKPGQYYGLITYGFTNPSVVTGASASCQQRFEIDLKVDEKNTLPVILDEDKIITAGDSIRLDYRTDIDADDLDKIVWKSDDIEIPCDLCPSVYVSPLKATTYSVELVDHKGCISTDEIEIRVRYDNNVFIPNAISPNGDGINDVFYIQADISVVKINKLSIFDRWGINVFSVSNIQPNDLSAGWDGKFRNELTQPGVFVYFAELEFQNGSREIYKGDLTVIR